MSSKIDGESPSHPNLGWHLFKRSKQEVYFGIRHTGILNCPLRDGAFVLWDAEGIARPAVTYNLREAGCMGSGRVHLLFGQAKRKCPEQRLENVRIPRAQMERIIEEFGSTFKYP